MLGQEFRVGLENKAIPIREIETGSVQLDKGAKPLTAKIAKGFGKDAQTGTQPSWRSTA
jgi:hypothetical protein